MFGRVLNTPLERTICKTCFNSFMAEAPITANQWIGFYVILASVMKELTIILQMQIQIINTALRARGKIDRNIFHRFVKIKQGTIRPKFINISKSRSSRK